MGERSGLLTHIAMMESASLCASDEMLTAFLELELAICACGELSRQFRVILLKLQLVAKFGEKKVREALDPLITKCKSAMRGECDPSYSSSEMNGGSVFR
jgi:3-deoxy-D-arabino-heptulosonate 7-phosphate (DAHP) synthase class II